MSVLKHYIINGIVTDKKQAVLLVCIQNSGSSQMAGAYFNQIAGVKAVGFSTGNQVSDKVNPAVV